jgi:hypothetical protein
MNYYFSDGDILNIIKTPDSWKNTLSLLVFCQDKYFFSIDIISQIVDYLTQIPLVRLSCSDPGSS